MIITKYKDIGQTCKDIIDKYENEKIAYVGRLDPMARGLITILMDEDVKLMPKYIRLNKTYKFQFIMSVNTDTDDILGILKNDTKNITCDNNDIINYINNFPTKFEQAYHNFSAYTPSNIKTDDGKRKPLWWWSLHGYKLDIPKRNMQIFNKKIYDVEKISGLILKNQFIERINKIKDDTFRKDETIKQWKNYDFNIDYDVFTCEFEVSSGFFVRQFVKDMSDALNVKILVIDINRTSISY